jgi:superfamily II DNA or RNA helicase
MISKYLPIRALQERLPLEQLELLGALLLRMDEPGADVELLSNKQFLGQLFDSFYGADLLAQRSSRQAMLECVPENELRALAQELSFDSTGSFKDVAGSVAAIEWGNNQETTKFLEFFGYPAEFMPEPFEPTPVEEFLSAHDKPHKTLHRYQSDVFYETSELLKTPCCRVLLQMPTGAGKTRTAMEIISRFMNESPGSRVLWVAHSEELCDQAVGAFKETWAHVGRRPVRLLRCWGGNTPIFPAAEDSFTVAGFSKAHQLLKSRAARPQANLVVVDEAHMSLAPTYSAVIEWARSMSARVLGLTATPGRSMKNVKENTALSDFYNENIVSIPDDGDGVIHRLQGMGILANCDRDPLYTNIDFHLTVEEWKALEEDMEYSKAFLERVAVDQERNRIIIEKLWALAAEGKQVLLFAASVEQSRMLCAALIYKGYSASHIDGGTSKENRRSSIAKFRRGEIKVICNYGVLATGFDAPNVDVVFIARPTKSIVLYSQMIGRGMRGPAVGGTETFTLVDVIDNVTDYSSDLDDIYEYFEEYWG